MKLLNFFSITSVDSIFFNKNKEVVIVFVTNQGSLSVKLLDVMCFSVSNDVVDMKDEILIIDVSHDFRKLNANDLDKYLFQLNDVNMIKKKFHVIRVHGNSIIDVVCGEVVIQ